MESNTIKFGEGEEYDVTFKFDTPKQGTNQHGEWNLYGVTHKGVDASFFASKGLHSRIRTYKEGDTIKIVKRTANGRTSWDIKQLGTSPNQSVSSSITPDARTKDIHRQVCLKLAVESIGTKAKVTDAYYEDVRNRMNGLIMVLDPIEVIKDKFDGEELSDEEIPF